MQLQAAGAGLPSSMAAGLPPGFLQAGLQAGAGANAAAALAAAGLPGLPPGFLGGMPPASVAAHMAAAGIRPPGLPPVTTASVSAELAARAAAREEDSVKAALSMFFESLKTHNIFISLAMSSFIPIFSFSGTSSANSDDRNVSQFLKNHQHHVLARNILLTSLSKSFTNLMHYVLKETFKILENNENEDRRKLPAHLMMRFYDFSVKLLKIPKTLIKSF